MTDEHLETGILIDYLHHELAPGADAHVMQHIANCSQCRAAYDAEAELSEGLRGYTRATERDLPPGVAARIWDAIERDAAAPSWVERLVKLLRPAYAIPVAAALVIALYFSVAAPRSTHTAARIDAAYYLEDHAALTSTVPFNEGTVVPASLENDETGSDQHWVASTGASDIAAGR